MATRQHVIELNGNQYDALTGKVISQQKTSEVKKPAAAPHSHPKRLDGFIRRKAATHSATAKKVHSQLERSKTLMRSGVKKPVHITAQVHHIKKTPAAKPRPLKSPGLVEAVKPERALHATLIHKSKLITRFGKDYSNHIKSDVVPVKSAPREVLPRKAAALAHPITSKVVSNPFDTALEKATSHQQPKLKKDRLHHKIARKLHITPRVFIAGSGSFVLLLIAGFLAYNNVPNVAVRVASMRAGVSATLPSYRPAGFSLEGPISYQPGQITLNYKSTSDDSRDFSVVQRASDWNSETLLDNFVTTNTQQYQTVQANGRTIYIYDGGNATWVDGGTWYEVIGKSTLNNDQLLRIANSL